MIDNRVTAEEVILEVLEQLRVKLKAHQCQDCEAQNYHSVCEQPDVAEAIEEVIRERKVARETL